MNSSSKTITLEKPIELNDLEPFIESMLTAGNRLMFHPRGNSMRPFLHDRREKIVLLRPSEGEEYRRGEIVFYKRDSGSFVLHRIVGKRADGFILCGDAQSTLEFAIRPDQIIARVEGFYRGNRFVDCRQNRRYRFFVALWMFLRPIRRGFFILRHPIRKISSFFQRFFSTKGKS